MRGSILCFSALQRAENSSTFVHSRARRMSTEVSVLFSEPKIPQPPASVYVLPDAFEFQCSSASRKFLNDYAQTEGAPADGQFQCSSASRKFLNYDPHLVTDLAVRVSVLFSEPKIPQPEQSSPEVIEHAVSVIFSEPKIPQHRPSHLRPSIFPTAMITLRHS